MVSLGIFSVVHPTEPCALRSTQPLNVSTRDFSWGKGGRCILLTTYHPCNAVTSRNPGRNLPGTPWATSACRRTPLVYFYTIGVDCAVHITLVHNRCWLCSTHYTCTQKVQVVQYNLQSTRMVCSTHTHT